MWTDEQDIVSATDQPRLTGHSILITRKHSQTSRVTIHSFTNGLHRAFCDSRLAAEEDWCDAGLGPEQDAGAQSMQRHPRAQQQCTGSRA